MSLSQTVEWIPVSERLPDDVKFCQIATDKGVWMGWHSARRSKWFDSGDFEITGVEYWMPLPLHPDKLRKEEA